MMLPSEQFLQWAQACTGNGNTCSDANEIARRTARVFGHRTPAKAGGGANWWWGKAAAFREALVLVKPLEAKLAEAEEALATERLRPSQAWIFNETELNHLRTELADLRVKAAEAQKAQITEEEVGLLIRRVLVEHLDREEQIHSQFPRSELLGIAWFREIVAAKQHRAAREQDTEPEPPTCKCGACTYDAAAQDYTCIMGDGDHVHLRPGQHCTESGEKLEVPA